MPLCCGVATFVFCWVHCVLFLGIMLSRVPMEHLCFVECIVCFGLIYQYYVFFAKVKIIFGSGSAVVKVNMFFNNR